METEGIAEDDGVGRTCQRSIGDRYPTHVRPQCPKLRSRCIAMVREDDLEEIAKNIEGNLKEDAKSSTFKEEDIPPEEEDNLNKSSGKDEEMYSWGELKYKANYILFISNESIERQV